MASVLNRTTKQFWPSANTPDYPSEDWIINPDMGAVVGFDSRYWLIVGDLVTLMTAPQRAAVDAAALEAQRDAEAAQLDQIESITRAFMLVVLDEFNNHAGKLNAILDAIDAGANLASVKANIAAIADYPPRTAEQLRNAMRAKLGS